MRIARGISVTNTSKPVGITYDADALAFFTAASITDTTQKNAVNTLVLSLKSANIWSKMKALYPVVGGVASSHAVNLKTPGTYNLTFSTGWTHSNNGMTPLTAYANTSLTPSVILSLNSTHLSYYSRTNSINTGLIGSQLSGGGDAIQLVMGSNFLGGRINDNTYSQATVTNTQAFMMHNRNSSTSKQFWRNAVSYSYTITSTSRPNQTILLGAYNNNGGITNYDDRQCAFASIGDGLTDAEASAFYTAVQNYQTTLGRQV